MPAIYHRCTKCSHVDTVRDLCVACGNPTYQQGLCGECTMRLTRMAGSSAIGALLEELFDGIRACVTGTVVDVCEACGRVRDVICTGGNVHACAECIAADAAEPMRRCESCEEEFPASYVTCGAGFCRDCHSIGACVGRCAS